MTSATTRLPQDTLPARLQQVLESMTDRRLASRLERVYRAAALAIDRLGHLSIVKYEPSSARTAGADLELWEKMAPAIRDTLVDVNALVAAVHKDFPPPEPKPAEQGWTPPPYSWDERMALEVESVLHACAARLSRRVADLGQRVRRPEVVSDAWALMAELQSFRADFRSQIADLVYLTAAAFAEVRREEVIPGYATQTQVLVALRGALVDLHRSLKSRLERAAGTAPNDMPALARRLEDTLAAFTRLPAAFAMKARDKRPLLALREQLQELASQATLSAEALVGAVEPFLQLLERCIHDMTHTALTGHDRAVWAACGARLEQAALHLFLGSPGAERVLREALQAADSLYGRAAELDGFLRKARTLGETLDDETVRETLELFRERLASLPFG